MYHFKFADIGEGVHEGVIHEWLVAEGDTIKDGQTLFTVETDKVTAEIPSPIDGEVAKINFKVGDTIHVGDVAVEIDDGSSQQTASPQTDSDTPEDDLSDQKASGAVNAEQEGQTHKESVEEGGSTSVVGEIEVSSDVIASSDEGRSGEQAEPDESHKVLATPVARKLAKDLAVDINKIKGSGPSGRVMQEDIKAYANENSSDECVAKPSLQPSSSAEQADETRLKLTQIRKTIANKMTQSKFTIPHTAAMDDADVSKLVEYRQKLNAKLAERDIKLSYLPFIIKAVAIALKKNPRINASLDSDSDEIVLKHYINIGIATDTEKGLTVPVLKNADQLSLLEISDKLIDQSARARSTELSLDDLKGGTFTITNYGSIGTKYGVPVINFPEAAIIGIGTIYKNPAVGENGEIVVQDTLPLSLSFDHRIIDGADAGRFMNDLIALLEDPDVLLIS